MPLVVWGVCFLGVAGELVSSTLARAAGAWPGRRGVTDEVEEEVFMMLCGGARVARVGQEHAEATLRRRVWVCEGKAPPAVGRRGMAHGQTRRPAARAPLEAHLAVVGSACCLLSVMI